MTSGYFQAYFKKYPWKKIYNLIHQRCTNINNASYNRYGGRGIKCLITQDELKKLWFRDKAYNLKQPSIDRIDNDGHYQYDNCQFIEMRDNNIKAQEKKVIQYSKTQVFIKEWKSVREAAFTLNINEGNIGKVIKGIRKSAGKYIWKRKD